MVIIGYTHYWRRPEKISQEKFDKIQADVRKIIDACTDMDIKIRGVDGIDEPIVTSQDICFNGDALACSGDFSHEAFDIPRIDKEDSWHKMDECGVFGGFTKTARKPYDIAVTSALIVLKHYLGEDCEISSDGKDKDWFEAKMLCDKLFGYGLGYTLNDVTYNLYKTSV